MMSGCAADMLIALLRSHWERTLGSDAPCGVGSGAEGGGDGAAGHEKRPEPSACHRHVKAV